MTVAEDEGLDSPSIEAIVQDVSVAPSPFDKSTVAGAVLRSCDLVDFRIRQCILTEASTFFEGLFSLPQGPSSEVKACDTEHTEDGLPVITMSEDSATLEDLLRICYPVRNPEIKTIEELRMLLEAATKYAVDVAVDFARDRLSDFAESMPLRVYAIAVRYGFKEETKFAAKCFLNHPVHTMYEPELEEITGGAYHRLLEYHRRCSVAASGLINNLRWINPEDKWVWFHCYNCNGESMQWYLKGEVLCTPRQWWIRHLRRSGDLLKERPSGKAISEEGRIDEALKDALSCATCGQSAYWHMKSFTGQFAVEVEKEISKVRAVSLPK